ncbi:hypothetical protein N1028_04305 [Herbiconiux sp. CPCC 203407]|uniref:Uncharacterized protein n=1 Tax=Herbiconiux oxytropis TaxID=2970915 RepID=A0AA41XES3_9MICO|nr:hypothetical protein [Herbiconiux oxytropis]MCS5723212.1 hypothetical protein [Herbiconiux oxytropis]MCS5725113.1 hypothetical protein [Herbiconiux oxytropis]
MNARPRVPAVHPFPATAGLTVLLAAFVAELGFAGAIVLGAVRGESPATVVTDLLESTTAATVWGFLAVAGAFVIALQVSWTSLSDGTGGSPPGHHPVSTARLDDRLRRVARFRWAALLAGAFTLNAWLLALLALTAEPAVQLLTSLGMAGVVFFAVDAATVVLRFDTRPQLIPAQRRAVTAYAGLPARDRRALRRHPRAATAAGVALGIAWIAVIEAILIASFVALVGASEPQAEPARLRALSTGAPAAALEIALTGALLVAFAIAAVALARASRASTSRWSAPARPLAVVGSVLLLAPAVGFTVWLVVVLVRAGMPIAQALLLGAIFASPSAIPVSALLAPGRASRFRIGPRAAARLVIHGLQRAELESRLRRIRLLEAVFDAPTASAQSAAEPAAQPPVTSPPPPPSAARSFTFTLVIGREHTARRPGHPENSR